MPGYPTEPPLDLRELTALPRGIHIVTADGFDAPASIPHIREINIPYGEFLVTTLSVH